MVCLGKVTSGAMALEPSTSQPCSSLWHCSFARVVELLVQGKDVANLVQVPASRGGRE